MALQSSVHLENLSLIDSHSQPVESLCQRCASIDLEDAFSTESKSLNNDNGRLIVELAASAADLKTASCPFCRLLAAVCPCDGDDSPVPNCERFHLRAFSANKLFSKLSKAELTEVVDIALLGVVRVGIKMEKGWVGEKVRAQHFEVWNSLKRTGCIGTVLPSSSSSFGVRKVCSAQWDIDFGKECIEFCRAHHIRACVPRNRRMMAQIRVIHCQCKEIVLAPLNCEYVALSYVWGKPEGNSSGQVSMDVTLKLKYRYLWIDRYCINQDDEQDRHNQLRQMDLIYANAQLTIIAAAGADTYQGLPGANGIPRTEQPHLDINDRTLLSTLPQGEFPLENSKWATRGWTYQEGLLSKRRMIFTRDQVYFECNGMHQAESLNQPLDSLHIKNKRRFKAPVPKGAFMEKNPGARPWEIMAYISRFSKRELTFPEDALNAMEGIFHVFATSQRPVYHFLGVPILPPIAVTSSGHFTTSPQGRTPEQSFLIGLCWYHEKYGVSPAKRNYFFPSWSWAGWTGTVANKLLSNSLWITGMDGASVWIEEKDGGLSAFPREFRELRNFRDEH